MLPSKVIYDPHLKPHWKQIADALVWAADNGYAGGEQGVSAFAALMGTTAQRREPAGGVYHYFAERPWE